MQIMTNPTMDDFISYGIFHENPSYFPYYDPLLHAHSWELEFYNEDFRKRVLKLANEISERWNKTKELPSDYYEVLKTNSGYRWNTTEEIAEARKQVLKEMDEKYKVKE